MTLLDSQLFQRIDSAELLTWVQEQVNDMIITFLLFHQIVILNHSQHPQAEEKSLNLTKFTEHFNNMSYWTRTIILQQPDAKVVTRTILTNKKKTKMMMLISVCPQERERYVMKFIKIMKWLRKMNNFNSYLAILSALDSAPIRRLGSFLI